MTIFHSVIIWNDIYSHLCHKYISYKSPATFFSQLSSTTTCAYCCVRGHLTTLILYRSTNNQSLYLIFYLYCFLSSYFLHGHHNNASRFGTLSTSTYRLARILSTINVNITCHVSTEYRISSVWYVVSNRYDFKCNCNISHGEYKLIRMWIY